MKIQNYYFKLINNIHPTNIYFQSPITGELIEIQPPFSINKYTYILIQHIKQYT